MESIFEIIKLREQNLLNLLNLICLSDCISSFLLPHGLISFLGKNGIILAIVLSYIMIYHLLRILYVLFCYFFQRLGIKRVIYIKNNKFENKKMTEDPLGGDFIIFISTLSLLGELAIPSNTILFYINQNFTGINVLGYSFTANFIVITFIFILIGVYFGDFLERLFDKP